MSRYLPYLPIVLAVFLIVGLTIPQIIMTDRLSGSNVTAEQRAELLKRVPKEIGDWHGEDMEIDEVVREKVGAVGAVSRIYRNVRTGEKVDLWLIVGHARVISGHTPDICYPSSGFETRAAENSVYPFSVEGEPDATFLTNTFFKEDVTGRQLVRVFWAWYNAAEDEDRSTIEWEGPANPRLRFGNSRALYKMYFTSTMTDPMETAEQSSCLRFAREFLPVLNKALAEVNDDSGSTTASPAATPPAQEAETAAAPGEASEEATAAPPTEETQPVAEEATAPASESLNDIFGGEATDR